MAQYQTYKPVDCHFYDMLEAVALKRSYIDITFKVEGETREIRAFIDDLRAENGEEFMYLHNGKKIRLDQIVEVDGNYNPSTDLDQIGCLCH